MQHAIINSMKCMRAIKDRISRPVYQLENQTVEPIYHAQQISRWKSSVRDLRTRQPITSRWSSDTTSQSAITSMIELDFSGTKSQSASHNVALNQNCKGTAQVSEANQLPPATAITAGEHPNLNPKAETIGRTNGFHNTKKSATLKSSQRGVESLSEKDAKLAEFVKLHEFWSSGSPGFLATLCPRLEGRLLRQPALEGLTRSVRTDSPRKTDRIKSDQSTAAAAAWRPTAAVASEEGEAAE
ncbi:hypothetical protein F511_09514 [Dorcoceras hygrometricum]|uniref:Uncharacterized protein n=1 Tax=Dorcoceras hygrometricum TaxID=472368 RepID=A0A2Z7BMG4_9LAMI|nr:hypothetical protein F511_09514 [Dorcoceras hygrometricum]